MTQALDVARLAPPWRRQRVAPSVAPAGSPPGAVTFPGVPLVGQVRIALGADLTKPPSSWVWTDITPYVRFDAGISTQQGRIDWTAVVRTSSGALELDNRDGRFSRRNPNSPYYGLLTLNTPIWATIDAGTGPVTRLAQFVNEWPTRWDRSASDSTVPIATAGIMRRLAQGAVKRSALRRSILIAAASGPLLAYWPLEDGSSSTSGLSGLANGRPTSTLSGGATFGASLAPGSAGAVSLASGGSFTAPTGQAVVAAPNGWEFECAVAWATLPTITAGQMFSVAWANSTGPAAQMGFGLTNFGGVIYWADFIAQAGSGAFVALIGLGPVQAGVPYHVRVVGHQEGAGLRVTVYVNGVSVFDDGFNGTLMMPDSIVVGGVGASPVATSPANPSTFTQLAFWAPRRTTVPLTYLAANGYLGELATDRIRRMSAEEGVAVICAGGPSVAMGPQPVAAFLDILRDCEAADMGVLYEVNWGLGYQSANDRTNQPIGMALDRALNHIAEEPQPADDDQRIRNKWVVSRRNGSDVTAERTSGPLGTQPGGPGMYDDSATVNVATDAQLADQAGWRLRFGQVDEDRWPNIPLRFHGTPDLIPAWLALPFGARLTMANVVAQMAPDLIDAIIEGWSERWDPTSWDATLNTAPYSPYRVGTLAVDVGDVSSTLMILIPDTLALVAAVGTSDVTWSVSSDPPWTTNPESFPRQLMWEGEQISLTGCTGAASDAFGRTVSNGWGNADIGGAWTNAGGAASDFSVGSGIGNISHSSVNVRRNVTLPGNFTDFDVACDYKVAAGAFVSGAPVRPIALMSQYIDDNNHYECLVEIDTSGVNTVTFRKYVGGVSTVLAGPAPTGIAFATDTFWRLRVRKIGSQFQIKSWLRGNVEKVNWDLTATDTTYPGTGLIGISSQLNTGNTSTLPYVFSYDNFLVANPAIWTVVRSVNGIVKAHAVGSTGRIYRNGALSLT